MILVQIGTKIAPNDLYWYILEKVFCQGVLDPIKFPNFAFSVTSMAKVQKSKNNFQQHLHIKPPTISDLKIKIKNNFSYSKTEKFDFNIIQKL